MRSPDEEQEVEHAEEAHTADDVALADPQVGDSSEAEAAAVAGTEAEPHEAAEGAQAEDRGADARLVFHDLSKLSIPDASAKEVELEESVAESPVLGLQAEEDASVVSPGKANFVQVPLPSLLRNLLRIFRTVPLCACCTHPPFGAYALCLSRHDAPAPHPPADSFWPARFCCSLKSPLLSCLSGWQSAWMTRWH
jgi:hypothetical protein